MPEPLTLRDLIARDTAPGRAVTTRDHVLPLTDLTERSPFGGERLRLEGRSVAVLVQDMAKAAAALIDLEGWARRIVLIPPGWSAERLATVLQDAEVDAIVLDEQAEAPAIKVDVTVRCLLPMQPADMRTVAPRESEWILPTSGTNGPPKLVIHTLRTLTAAIGPAPLQQWATFYDIRRYGGLQIFLRAVAGKGSLTLRGADEGVDAFLARVGDAGVTHISGTPSHWRKALMSPEARKIDPAYVRLSGEIADDSILRSLCAAYPNAKIEHAYASTEAGVVFSVGDGKAGFPAAWMARTGEVRMRVEDGTLRVRAPGRAKRFASANALEIADGEGFVDTGDMVEPRGDRVFFVGRRGGVINVGGAKVHPEEVEAALNEHASVRASHVFARRNPIVGALVVADVVLQDPEAPRDGVEQAILAACRRRLPAYMTPSKLRFVADLPMTDGGKLSRHG